MTMRREDCLDVASVERRTLDIGLAPGIWFQELSEDDETHATHWVIEIPENYHHDGTVAVASGMDIFVLDGVVEIDGHVHEKGAYSYLPAGASVSSICSQAGARAIVLNAGAQRFDLGPGRPLAELVESGQAQINVRTWELPWRDPMQDIVKRSTWIDPETGKAGRPAGVVTKTLRRDAETGELLALTAQVAGFIDPGTEVHPHNECLYLVAGDAYIGLTYDRDRKDVKKDLVLHKDHYISRHPGIWHGPVATQTGTLWLVHLSDGYTGIFGEVDNWKELVGSYLAEESFR